MLAHGTGHRIEAIRQLKWSEIDIDDETVRWRAAADRTSGSVKVPEQWPSDRLGDEG